MHKNGTIFKLNIKPAFTKKEGEIAGIFAGDGSLHFEPIGYHYTVVVHFGLKNLMYAVYVKNLFENFFGKRFRLEKSNPTTIRIITYSKEIFYFFKNYLDYNPKVKHSTVKLKTNKFPLDFKIGFLKGLVDTDGCIWFSKEERRHKISFCTTSEQLAYQVKNTLSELDIKTGLSVQVRKYRNEKPVYYINIWKCSVDRFINIMEPLKARTERGRWRNLVSHSLGLGNLKMAL